MASALEFEHVGQLIVRQPEVAVVHPAELLTYIPGGARLCTYVRIRAPVAGQFVVYVELQAAPRTLAHRVAACAAAVTK
jgi:hypothetical protein